MEHLYGVSSRAGVSASKIGLGHAGQLIGLLHDLGKYSDAFQRYLRSATGLIDQDADDYVDASALKGKVDHSTAGAQFVWQQLSPCGARGGFFGQILALCIASHHSGLIDCISAAERSFGEDLFTRRMHKDVESSHLSEAVQFADPEILSRAQDLFAGESLCTGIERLVQAIVCNEKNCRTALAQQLGLVVRFLFSCLIDADRTDTANFESHRGQSFRQDSDYVDWPILVARLEHHLETLIPSHHVDILRRDISNECLSAGQRTQGIFSLTVPTGGGKTLSSLRFALHHAQRWKLDRIIYVVPFTSIIDQNAEVTRRILEPKSQDQGTVVLEHHSNLTPEHQTWREKILCENWDAPVVYTTAVQFLDTLFGAGTRGARRMHQLANSVIIFDEIQTLPVKCVHLFNNAINFLAAHCGSTIVLSTATQPLLHKVDAKKGALRCSADAELVRGPRDLFDLLKRVDVRDRRKAGGWTYLDTARLATVSVGQHSSCLVIVNTKEAARSVYLLCSELAPEARVHLSTDMCPAHRKERLHYIRLRLESGLPLLCVSTQLIEAGVDVDFGSVIRFLAGLDSIAQAAGRCNRNGRAESGPLYIVNSAEENVGTLPDIQKGSEVSRRVLDDYRADPTRYGHNILGPEAIEDYYHHYFFARREEMSYALSAEVLGHDDTILNLLAGNGQAVQKYQRTRGPQVPIHFQQSFMTAAEHFHPIDSPTRGILVSYGEEGRRIIAEVSGAFEPEKQYGLLRQAQQFTVNVFPHVLKRLADAGALHPIQEDVNILALDERYYSKEFGLSQRPVGNMEHLSV